MRDLAEIVKEFLVPGSVPFLILTLAIGVALLYSPRRARVGRWWLTILVLTYWLISVPAMASWLQARLTQGYAPLPTANDASGARAVVVLSGGARSYRVSGRQINIVQDASALRTLEAARLYRLLGGPTIILSGGIADPAVQLNPESEAMREALVEAGVPADRILIEGRSRTTREQVLNLVPLLKARGISRFVLVTSPTHMRRALAAFAREGLHPVPSSAPAASEGGQPNGWRGLPSEDARAASESVLREYIALAYYRSRGWLGTPGSSTRQ